MDPQRLHGNIILVRGPSGCGKDTMIRFYAKKYGYKVRKDREIEGELEMNKAIELNPEHYNWELLEKKEAESVSYVKVFASVIERASFERNSRKKFLYYMRDIPAPRHPKEFELLKDAFEELTRVKPLNIVPIIFNINSNIYE